MRPPLKIELWTAEGHSRLLNMTMSVEASQLVYDESVPKLNVGEVIRCRDAGGAVVFSSDPNE